MGGIKPALRKFSGGANLTHPKLTFWGVLTIIASVVAILIAVDLGKKLLGKGKSVIGAATPGPSGKGDLRARLGI